MFNAGNEKGRKLVISDISYSIDMFIRYIIRLGIL